MAAAQGGLGAGKACPGAQREQALRGQWLETGLCTRSSAGRQVSWKVCSAEGGFHCGVVFIELNVQNDAKEHITLHFFPRPLGNSTACTGKGPLGGQGEVKGEAGPAQLWEKRVPHRKGGSGNKNHR